MCEVTQIKVVGIVTLMVEIYREGQPNVFVERLEGGLFEDMDLHRADFRFSSLQGANFVNVRLVGAFLEVSNLRNARFENCTLINASLIGANCEGASFINCELMFAMFDRANLRGVDFSSSTFQFEEEFPDGDWPVLLTDAVFDATTKWPPGFDPEQFGAIRV